MACAAGVVANGGLVLASGGTLAPVNVLAAAAICSAVGSAVPDPTFTSDPGPGSYCALPLAANRRGPSTDPNAPHNKKIRETADAIPKEEGKIEAGGGRLPEKLIPTPGGKKTGRRPDILIRNPDGSQRGINVGRTRADGTPVTREQEAIRDLEGAGIPTEFVPYDR